MNEVAALRNELSALRNELLQLRVRVEQLENKRPTLFTRQAPQPTWVVPQ